MWTSKNRRTRIQKNVQQRSGKILEGRNHGQSNEVDKNQMVWTQSEKGKPGSDQEALGVETVRKQKERKTEDSMGGPSEDGSRKVGQKELWRNCER